MSEQITAELEEKYQKKLVFYYNEEGLLTQYPTKRPLRQIVLRRIAEQFAFDKDYTEKEVNRIIRDQIAFSDVELIRRELYQERFMDRLKDGSKYWREQ